MDDYAVVYDDDYSEELNRRILDKYGSSGDRYAVHLSDLLYCLRKAWGKRRVDPESVDRPTDETLLTWAGGLMFEDLIASGERQKKAAYCFHCRIVSRVSPSVKGEGEPILCNQCERPWILFTPDYIDDGLIHEAKQTRKSRRKGPEDAPWWIDQLRSYKLFARRAGWTDAHTSRLVVNWLMGDYGRKKKGMRPLPPQSAIDAYLVFFDPEREKEWEEELLRRMQVVLLDEAPPLTGMGEALGGAPLSPSYDWECPSCPVGRTIGCERWVWGDDDYEVGFARDDDGKDDRQDDGSEGASDDES